MSVSIACTSCRKPLRVPETSLGKKVKCPLCGTVFVATPAARGEQAGPPPAGPHPAASKAESKTRDAPAAPVPPKEEGLEVEEVREGERPDFAPLAFKVAIKDDPERELKGQFQARLTPEGLELRRKNVEVLLPVGTPAKHLAGNRLRVEVEEREVELAVTRFNTYQERLTRDLVAFLRGKKKRLDASDYALPWYLYVPVALPIGIPVLTLGGAIPAALGFGLVAGCYAVAQKEKLPVAARILICLGLSGVGYAVLIAVFFAAWFVNPQGGADRGGAVVTKRADPPAVGQPQPAMPAPAPRVVAPVTILQDAGHVKALAYSRDGSLLAAAGERGARLWRTVPLQEQKSLAGVRGHLTALAIAPDGQTLATADLAGTVRTWNIATGKEVAAFPSKSKYLSLAFAPGGQTLAGSSNVIRLWDLAQKTERALTLGNDRNLVRLAFAPNGAMLAAGGQAVRLWEMPAGQEQPSLAGPPAVALSLAFNPRGTVLAVAYTDRTIRLWDPLSRQEMGTLAGHQLPISSLAFAPQGGILVSGAGATPMNPGDRGELKFWDVAAGKELASPEGHTRGVSAVAFAPDGKTVATAGGDGTVRLWDVAAVLGQR